MSYLARMSHHRILSFLPKASGCALAGLLLCASLQLVACSTEKNEKTENTKTENTKNTEQQGKAMATSLSVEAAEPDFPCHSLSVDIKESSPVQFDLRMTRDMASPGYKIEIDGVDAAKDGVIVARMTAVPPDGASLTVIEPTPLRFELGSLAAATYRFELMSRDSKDGAYEKILQASLVAR